MKSLTVIFLLSLLAGCAGRGVAPEQRDRIGRYDGNWSGIVELTDELQPYKTHLVFSCNRYTDSIHLTVADGYVRGSVGDDSMFSTPIAAAGNFFTRIPVMDKFRTVSTRQNGTMGQANILIAGRLDNITNTGSGTVTFVPGTIDSGCRADFSVKKNA